MDLFFEENKNLLPDPESELYYYPTFYSVQDAGRIFSGLQNDIAWEQKNITIYGKQFQEPRLSAWYGDESARYQYSGILLDPKPWTPLLLDIKLKLEQEHSIKFNAVLLNYYRNGTDSMGWHRDNEKELGKETVIASLSFGAVRSFQVRKYDDNSQKLDLPLASGSLLIMRGKMQERWEHSLPKRLKLQSPRINLTFRRIV
jgi:alkylated DNA repair dioxygenase AlkB